jgi:plastocyanin
MRFLIFVLFVQFGFAGTIEGIVYRNSGSMATPQINRYSLRGSPSKNDSSSTSGNLNLAVVYLTGKDVEKKKVKTTQKIIQKNLAFEPWLLPVQVGTTVDFPNMDLVFHNVFSYSKAKKFDLGRYAQGQSKQVLFDKPGLVQVFCEIHRTMRAYILVLETGYFTTTDDQGKFQINDIPAGNYKLHVWQENTEEFVTSVEVKKSQTTKLEVR